MNNPKAADGESLGVGNLAAAIWTMAASGNLRKRHG